MSKENELEEILVDILFIVVFLVLEMEIYRYVIQGTYPLGD